MGEWLKDRDKYLAIMLEMEGLTKAPDCSMCSKGMVVKCSDCLGGNYFCKGCCLKLHARHPFHRILRWTGSHFQPTSLHSLGFLLSLGHDGAQCPWTVEVCRNIFNVILPRLICEQGAEAKRKAQASKTSKMRLRSASLASITEDADPALNYRSPMVKPDAISNTLVNSPGLSDSLFDHAEPLLEDSTFRTRRTRTAASGNALLTVVHHTGIYDMEALFCICENASDPGEQLIRAQMLPSSFNNIETVFTFAVLDDFLTDNLECKTTAQQYFSKLQSLTNKMFPDRVPVCYAIRYFLNLLYANYAI